MARINHGANRFRGRTTEQAFPKKNWRGNGPAKAANQGKSMSAEERRQWAAENGYAAA